MDPSTYKLLHFFGIIFLMLGLGAAANAAKDGGAKLYAIFHGIGALLLLVSGFGLQAKLGSAYTAEYGSSFPWWMIVKIVIWLLLGAAIAVLKRRLLPPALAWTLIAVFGCVAAYLGLVYGHSYGFGH